MQKHELQAHHMQVSSTKRNCHNQMRLIPGLQGWFNFVNLNKQKLSFVFTIYIQIFTKYKGYMSTWDSMTQIYAI